MIPVFCAAKSGLCFHILFFYICASGTHILCVILHFRDMNITKLFGSKRFRFFISKGGMLYVTDQSGTSDFFIRRQQ